MQSSNAITYTEFYSKSTDINGHSATLERYIIQSLDGIRIHSFKKLNWSEAETYFVNFLKCKGLNVTKYTLIEVVR